MSASSDLLRPRQLLGAALGAALGVAAVAAWSRPSSSPGPISAAHTHAGVSCASCHGSASAPTAAGSCIACHVKDQHGSTRAGHRAMAQAGRLRCVDCHSAHGETQAVSFIPDGHFVRSGRGGAVPGALGHATPEVTVPLVPLAACARCHDLASASDPVARCVGDPRVPAQASAALCMDEHRTGIDGTRGAFRPAAWRSAREVAGSTPWVGPSPKPTWPWTVAPLALAAAFAALGSVRRRAPAAPVAPPLVTPRRRLPQIDPTTCLGCYACVDACPFDVLEVQSFVAVVARPDDCCGAVSCREVCPNGSLTIADGEVAPHAPRVDERLESLDAPGVFVAGDLTGVPLIRNAIEQGVRVIDAISERPRAKAPLVDVVIVGAGPAGLSAALRCRELGLRFVVLEQSTVAASIRAFPRQKLVLDQGVKLPLEGTLWMRETTKEELLLEWTRALRRHKITVREGERVTDVRAVEEGFEVVTERGVERGRHVLLATGRRGTPRPLDLSVAPGAEAKVSHSLADARSFAGRSVLVVGLGDSAMEAALALAAQPGTRVTVCSRGADFKRGKARNVESMRAAVDRGVIDLRFESELVAVGVGVVTVRTRGEEATVLNDAVLVMIGGAPATELLRAAGVRFAGVIEEKQKRSFVEHAREHEPAHDG